MYWTCKNYQHWNASIRTFQKRIKKYSQKNGSLRPSWTGESKKLTCQRYLLIYSLALTDLFEIER